MKLLIPRPPQRLARIVQLAMLLTLCFFAAACHKKTKPYVPPPPEPPQQAAPQSPKTSARTTQKPAPTRDADSDDTDATPTGPVLFSESGLASWYGAPYHNHKASNGEVFDMHALTAAHRTLPLNSVARVTNLKTGQSATVRITDRGPFITGRILDLSLGAAKAVGVYLPGVAQVRLDVLSTPAPIHSGGRWAVQIGGFTDEGNAASLKDDLAERYPLARVQQFQSVVGSWWLRIRLPNDDKSQADRIARDTKSSEGAVFLVRLD